MNLQERRRFRSALLFTGHMVDLPGMPRPRFPPRLEFPAAHAIEAAIDRQLERAQPGDVVAISSLARGGDILFQEGAEVRRLTSYVVLPFEPQVFVRKRVEGVSTGDWVPRFWRIWNRVPSEQREIVTSSSDENPYTAADERLFRIAQNLADEITLIVTFEDPAVSVLPQLVRAAGGYIDEVNIKELLARANGISK
jgi:hypothetical protein